VSNSRRFIAVGFVGALIAGATLFGGPASASPGPGGPRPATSPARVVTITIPASNGEIDAKWLSYPGPPRADVLLPAGYDPHRRYPLVVFLNGLGFNYDSYVQYGLTKPFETQGAIVVMPEGANGWYADWWNDGERGSPSWESYELDTVIPTIIARFPIRPERRYHALIGISMGGLGATYLGGRLPGFFGSVAALSGFLDPQWNATVTQAAMAVYSNAAANGDNHPYPIYGPPDGFYADGHNPTLLARNLANTRVIVSTGTGDPSDSDPDPSAFSIAEEKIIFPMSENYHAAFVAAGVDLEYQVHPGVHGIADFLDEIDAMLQWGLFEPVPPRPRSWENSTVATAGHLWDIDYRFVRPPNQVVRFERSGDILTISAAGSDVTITTDGGCAIRTTTPSRLRVPGRAQVSFPSTRANRRPVRLCN
jgi:S-formylglutathione hydrolase FrmB